MTLQELKDLAEKFRLVADDEIAVEALCAETLTANPGCQECADLCERMTEVKDDGDGVRAVVAKTKARQT